MELGKMFSMIVQTSSPQSSQITLRNSPRPPQLTRPTLEPRQLLATFNPVDGPAFASALTNAQLGDTIILNAGSTYTGNFVMKNKTTGSGWITIQSSNLAALPEGVRVSPTDAAKMPKLV